MAELTLDKIIIRPIISEKSTKLQQMGVYVFEVAWNATKPQIKKAVEAIYGVKVKRVNTLRQYGKRKVLYLRGGRVIKGKLPHKKKAYVTLEKGYLIDIYKGI